MFNKEAYCQRYFVRHGMEKDASFLSAAYGLGSKALGAAGNFFNTRISPFIQKHFGENAVGNFGNTLTNYGRRWGHKSNLLTETGSMVDKAKAAKAAQGAAAATNG